MDKFTTPTSTTVINTEAPIVTTAQTGVKAAQTEIEQAKRYLGNEPGWNRIERAPVEYLDALDRMVQEVQAAKTQSRDLTPEARMRNARGIASAWRTQAEQIVVSLSDAARNARNRYEARTRPDEPSSDPAAMQAMLANARTDVRMVLDQAIEEELADRLVELARSSDPAVQYLVLSDWPATYFRARDAKTAPLMWTQKRRKVLAEVLDESRVEDLDRLDAVRHVEKALLALRGGHEFVMHDNRDLFGASA